MPASHDGAPLAGLIERAQQGDTKARETLLEQYRPYLLLLARTQVESWMQAKVDPSDLVQQSLIDAYQDLAAFRGSTEPQWRAWLKQILVNNAYDVARRLNAAKRRQGAEQRIDPAADSQVAGLDVPADEASPSRVAVQQEDHDRLIGAIAQLSPEHQQVIILRNLDRLPFDEIAEQMGRTRPAVQMLWTRALRKLEALLNRPDDLSS